MTDFGSPDEPDLLTEAIDSAWLNLHVCQPGIVQSYDDATKTCNVAPALKRALRTDDGSIVYEALPIIQNVPVAVIGSPALSLEFELVKGDTVLLVFADYSFAAWRGSGQVAEPADVRKHGPSYPVAIPWHRPLGKPSSDEKSTIGKAGGVRVHFKDSTVEVGTGADFVAMAQKVDAACTALQAILNTFASSQAGASTGPLAPLAAGFSALVTALGSWPPSGGTKGSALKSDL